MNKKIFVTGVMLVSCSVFCESVLSPSEKIQTTCMLQVKNKEFRDAKKTFKDSVDEAIAKKDTPFCQVFSIIELGLIKTQALKSPVEMTDEEVLTGESITALKQIPDEKLEKVFMAMSAFFKTFKTEFFSISEMKNFFDKYDWGAETPVQKQAKKLEGSSVGQTQKVEDQKQTKKLRAQKKMNRRHAQKRQRTNGKGNVKRPLTGRR